ncbi:MAG TPA: class I SAM-dependent methyltransferase [Patescibacteria group bacterium]|nr:class I SAM-dependent methyltransferase [Patescibacteria group bacterium]
MLSKLFTKMFNEATERNIHNILSLLEENKDAKVIDIGCGDGQSTIRYKSKIKCKQIVGTDGVQRRLKIAKKSGIKTVFVNLEDKWPIKSNNFDIVISNQVIEHILNIDNFIQEIYRILKPGGYCVVSTENLASWHNIFALFLGLQDFSHTLLKRKHLGNPLSIYYGQKTSTWILDGHGDGDDSAYPHIKILTYKSLKDVFLEFGFQFVKGKGSGYYPLFGFLSRIANKIDPYHSHFITIKIRKPI